MSKFHFGDFKKLLCLSTDTEILEKLVEEFLVEDFEAEIQEMDNMFFVDIVAEEETTRKIIVPRLEIIFK